MHLTSREAWIPSEGYVLLLKPADLEILESDLRVTGICSKAIPKVPAALRRHGMLCFISAARGKLTHVARSAVHYVAESGRDKLDIWNLTELPRPLNLAAIEKRMTGSQAWRAKQALQGGHLSAAAFVVFLKALKALDAAAHEAATGLIDPRAESDDREPDNARINWAFQRDAVVTSLEIARISTDQLGLPPTAPTDLSSGATSVFDSDDDMVSIEDLIVVQDLDAVGDDWAFLKRQRYAAKTYENSGTRLTVILANKLDLERQLGVDLIYYNETFKSVVFVQYKMFKGDDGELGYRPDRQLAKEIARMDATAAELAKAAADPSCDGYRLGSDPFFLKFCSKLIPGQATGHVPGIYVPLTYWKLLAASPRAKGKRGATVVFDETFGRRRLTPTSFTDMVGRGWLGTSSPQSVALLSYLKGALLGKKGVVFALQSQLPVEEDEDGFELPAPSAPRKRKNKYPGRTIPRKVRSI